MSDQDREAYVQEGQKLFAAFYTAARRYCATVDGASQWDRNEAHYKMMEAYRAQVNQVQPVVTSQPGRPEHDTQQPKSV